jgi:ectoine hydroxylase-related dioxygenase (phytanoyl-CoA dioxygenase family)
MTRTPSLPPIRTDLAAAQRDLDEYGLTRLADATTREEIDEARQRLIAQAAAEDALGISSRDDGRANRAVGAALPNQRVWNLINKGEVFRRIAMNPTAHRLIRHLLGPEFLLFSITANIACKGGQAQNLHGDQVFAPADTPYPLIANCQWMLTDISEENGATRVVPGSHLAERWPAEGEAVATAAATGPAGTIMVWDGRLWHGTGVNTTNNPRHALLAAYCSPFIRQQENYSLSLAPDVMQRCTPELLTLLGFRNWKSLGMVDGSAPGELGSRPQKFSRELQLPE